MHQKGTFKGGRQGFLVHTVLGIFLDNEWVETWAAWGHQMLCLALPYKVQMFAKAQVPDTLQNGKDLLF